MTVGLFAKWPAPGFRQKPGLAAVTSAEWAAQVARALLLDTVDRLAKIETRRVLAFSPLESGWRICQSCPQSL